MCYTARQVGGRAFGGYTMPPTIKELQDTLKQHIDAGLEPEEAIRRLAVQFPDAKASDTHAAASVLADEYDHAHAEAEADAQTAKLMQEMITRAERESDRSGMNTGEALTYLAERGDQAAQAFVDDFNSPESQAFQRDFEAAVEWHPDWAKQVQEGHYSCKHGSDVDTAEKLVAAYRRSRR